MRQSPKAVVSCLTTGAYQSLGPICRSSTALSTAFRPSTLPSSMAGAVTGCTGKRHCGTVSFSTAVQRPAATAQEAASSSSEQPGGGNVNFGAAAAADGTVPPTQQAGGVNMPGIDPHTFQATRSTRGGSSAQDQAMAPEASDSINTDDPAALQRHLELMQRRMSKSDDFMGTRTMKQDHASDAKESQGSYGFNDAGKFWETANGTTLSGMMSFGSPRFVGFCILVYYLLQSQRDHLFDEDIYDANNYKSK